MSLIDSLTSEDLPLSYRFPRWNSAIYYPCASIVIFDINPGTADSEVEYSIFVAERDINPTLDSDNPRQSVLNDDGRWRDLTGRSITDITSATVDSDTVSFSFIFDDGDSRTFEVDVPVPAAGTGADSETVAIRVAADGTVDFGSNFADAGTARTAIRELLQTDFDKLVFEAHTDNGPGYRAIQYIDLTGAVHDITDTRFLGSPGTNGRLFIQTSPVIPPMETFNPSYTFNPLQATTLPWDVALTGFTINITNNPTSLANTFISPERLEAVDASAADVTTDLVLYNTTGTLTQTGNSTATYQQDADSLLRPIIPLGGEQQGGTVHARLHMQQTVAGTVTDFSDPTADITWTWLSPSVDSIAIDPLTGNTFLESYPDTAYSITHTANTISPANQNNRNVVSHMVRREGTRIVIADATGIDTNLTFNPPINKDRLPSALDRLLVDTTYTRPVGVANRTYSVTDMDNPALIPAPEFFYPSFFFSGTQTSPDDITLADIIAATDFRTAIAGGLLGGRINIHDMGPVGGYGGFTAPLISTSTTFVGQPLWFAIHSFAPQPTQARLTTNFGTSAPESTDPTNVFSSIQMATINLTPTPNPDGLRPEIYNIYGRGYNGAILNITYS